MHPRPPSLRLNQPPTYQDVCSGTTGFVEVLCISLTDPTPAIVEELFRFFFMFHDPTTKNRQGNDLGSQYASTIFCCDEHQRVIARQVKREIQDAASKGMPLQYHQKKVRTKIVDFEQFFPAEEEHQQYLNKNPNGYCNHYIRFRDWPKVDRFSSRVHRMTTQQRLKTHRRWNRRSIFSSFTKILAQMPQEEFLLIEEHKPTHRRWNRKSIFSSFTKILKEIDMPTVPVE